MLIFEVDFKVGDFVVMEPGIVVKVAGRDGSDSPSFFIKGENGAVPPNPINPIFFSRVATPEEIKAWGKPKPKAKARSRKKK